MKHRDELWQQLHETNRYPDPAFPVGVYTVTRERIEPPGRGYLDLHWHEELQFTLVDAGTMRLQVDGADYELRRGEAIFINRNLLHITTGLTPDGRYISLNFPDKLLGVFPGSRMEQDFVLPYTGNYALPALVLRPDEPWQNAVIAALREALHCFAAGDGVYATAVQLTRLWALLLPHLREAAAERSPGERYKQERIRQMLSFIHENYRRELRLHDIAAAGHVSEGECCRCFQSIVRKSPIQYLLSYRLAQGRELLTDSTLSVAEIAAAVGFADPSHFIRCFRRETGLTPGAYRQQKS